MPVDPGHQISSAAELPADAGMVELMRDILEEAAAKEPFQCFECSLARQRGQQHLSVERSLVRSASSMRNDPACRHS